MSSPGAAPHIEERVVETWAQRLRLRVKTAGSGPPLVYLHSAGGLTWDEFLTQLSSRYTIFAPEFPGMNPADSFAIHQLDDRELRKPAAICVAHQERRADNHRSHQEEVVQ